MFQQHTWWQVINFYVACQSVDKKRVHCGQILDVQEESIRNSRSSEKQALGDRENTWSVNMESTTENKIPSFR